MFTAPVIFFSFPFQVILLSALFLSLVFVAKAQTIDLRVNGIGIGDKYPAIVKALGRPASSVRRGEVPCGDAMQTLRYNGLLLRLEVGGPNPLGLYKVQITSPDWNVSGIRLGASKAEIISTFGKAEEMTEGKRRYLSYWIEDGWARIYLGRGNRVTLIEWEFNFC